VKVEDGASLGQEGWDRLLLTQPGASLLQSWAWGALQSRFGWVLQRRVFDEGTAGLCSLQLSPGILPGGAVGYVPRGPAVPATSRSAVVEELVTWAARQGCISLRIEPEAPAGDPWGEAFTAAGFRPGEPVQPAATQVVDLSLDPEGLRASFKPKTRYNLGLSERKGVSVQRSTDVQAFARLAGATASRQGIHLPGPRYYAAILELFQPLDAVRLYLATHEGHPLAGILVVRFGATATYLFGGSAMDQREVMPNYLLHWTAMCDFRAMGCTRYDLWGIPVDPTPDHPWFGLFRFKTGFGGQSIRYLGLYERILRPARFRLERRLQGWKRRIRRPILG
jgi:lipid II:glycine glycyltransferase (peptidoglycan interpeptide bridge formation enzyme)